MPWEFLRHSDGEEQKLNVSVLQIEIYNNYSQYLSNKFLWCSWLSRQSNTLKVSSSNLDGNMLPFAKYF